MNNPFWNVTITGADDHTDPRDLADLSHRFPFVEWGILFSVNDNRPRYPSRGWVERLAEIKNGPMSLRNFHLSAHFCGALAKESMTGTGWMLDCVRDWGFSRVQINGFALNKVGAMRSRKGLELILQTRDLDTIKLHQDFALARRADGERCSLLFDASGGRGLSPERWPQATHTNGSDVPVGYAGGITPDNVLSVIRELSHVEPTWIDMESGVRTDDRLDLAKVERVLSQVAGLPPA